MTTDRSIFKKGRLTAKPDGQAVKAEAITGARPLRLADTRDGLIYVPKAYHKDRPAALALMLHGSGGEPEHGLSYLRKQADERNIILVAPASRAPTWDIIAGESFDQDVIFIDQALALVFKAYAIDPEHMAIGGFSDGASYALCLGLSNGDLFTHILAFSPGFMYTMERTGKPAVFVSHGIGDRVLPVGPCSRRIVPQLEQQGYPLEYQEFEGTHEIPAPVAQRGIEWFFSNGAD